MAYVLAYKFNNYFNRRLKKINTLSDVDYDFIQSDTNLSFNPNDGVDTTFTLGTQRNPYDGSCDYLIYAEDNTIISRWFIIEQPRLRQGQYQLTLKRDLVADYEDEINNSTAFIERAILPSDSPLMFNQENISVNRIKKQEIPLKDATGVSWIVGYVKKLTTDQNITDITASAHADISSPSYRLENQYIDNGGTYRIPCNGVSGATSRNYYHILYNSVEDSWSYETAGSGYQPYGFTIPHGKTLDAIVASFITSFSPSGLTNYDTDSGLTFNQSHYDMVQGYSGKTYVESGVYFKCVVTNGSATRNFTSTNMANSVNTFLTSIGIPTTVDEVTVALNVSYCYWDRERTSVGDYKVTIPASHLRTKDTPYDIFCMPYGDVTLTNSGATGWQDVTVDKSLQLTLAQGIAEKLASNLLDLQLLPYCPIQSVKANSSGSTLSIGRTDAQGFTTITTNDNSKVSYLFWVTDASFSIEIVKHISPSNYKMESVIGTARLVSPNFNGIYEFSVPKNNGVDAFSVDCTYLPYRPYIHVAPVFHEFSIYGKDFNDPVGLICGGDFSISYSSDRWADYVINNKNYDDIFNKEVKTQEAMNDIALRQARVQAAVGTVTGIGAGAFTGSQLGGAANPTASVIGAVVGGTASAIGGALDVKYMREQQDLSLQLKRDLHGLQLDNIKSLPSSLSKVTAINANNKGFVILEDIGCTDEEKIAVSDYICWNSMNVGVIGKIGDYRGNSWNYLGKEDKGYIKAQLIRIEGIEDDYHLVSSIAELLDKGWYFK